MAVGCRCTACLFCAGLTVPRNANACTLQISSLWLRPDPEESGMDAFFLNPFRSRNRREWNCESRSNYTTPTEKNHCWIDAVVVSHPRSPSHFVSNPVPQAKHCSQPCRSYGVKEREKGGVTFNISTLGSSPPLDLNYVHLMPPILSLLYLK